MKIISDSEVGIRTSKIKKREDIPLDSNIVFDLKSTLSLRVAPPLVFLLLRTPIRNVAEAPTPNINPDKMDDSIFENSNASEKMTVVKYEMHRNTGARNTDTNTIKIVNTIIRLCEKETSSSSMCPLLFNFSIIVFSLGNRVANEIPIISCIMENNKNVNLQSFVITKRTIASIGVIALPKLPDTDKIPIFLSLSGKLFI
jgi:hypothetical protein